MLQCVAVCCRVLQCVAISRVYRRELQSVVMSVVMSCYFAGMPDVFFGCTRINLIFNTLKIAGRNVNSVPALVV